MKKSLTESGLRSKGIDMRDKIKDIEYFNTFINEDLARVKKFSDKLENGEVKEDRILPVKSKVHDLKLGIMIAGYSKGDELTLLEEEYLDLLAEWEEVWEPEYYNKNLKMISLGILFQVDRAFVKKVKNMLKKSNINDWLYNFLLDSLPISDRTHPSGISPSSLSCIADGNSSAVAFMRT